MKRVPAHSHMQNGSHVADERQALESRLGTLHAILRELEDLNEQKEAVYARYRHLYRPLAQPWRKGKWWLWFFALGTGTFFVIPLIMSMFSSLLPDVTDSSSTMAYALTILFLPPIVAIVGATVIKHQYNRRLLPGKNAKIRHANQATRARVEQEAAPEVAALDQRIQEISDSYSNFGYVGFFPDRYLNSVDVRRCWNFVRDHRAFSVQQAINLLEEELHRSRMENFQAAQLAEQERARRTAQVGNLMNAFGQIQLHQDLRDIRDRL